MLLREPSEELNDLAHKVIGAAIEVHSIVGPGFVESAYERALAIELGLRGIPFERQVVSPLFYKGAVIAEHRLDLVVGAELIIELKSVDQLSAVHEAQLRSYLKATGRVLGLLINFNVAWLKNGIRRIIASV
jgi:GxxExxY protein